MNTVLTIGVSDCSGGAGIQADLKAFTVLGCYGMAVVTAVTARNTSGAVGGANKGIQTVAEEVVASQMEAIAQDLPVGALKTGFLGSPAMMDAVAECIRQHELDQ